MNKVTPFPPGARVIIGDEKKWWEDNWMKEMSWCRTLTVRNKCISYRI
jgi:hypothetical protein